MSDAWHVASVNFAEDDGSLPTIDLGDLTSASIAKIYRYISAHGRCVTETPTIWDNELQLDAPLMSVTDPCDWVQRGRTDSFHCCFGGVSIDGVEIPVLGIFVFKNGIEIDFRMGRDWNPRNVDAFFRLLAYLQSLAPESTIQSAETEGLMDEGSFLEALRLYLARRGRTKP
ncbi:MAG: hypothetical protein GX575_12485 [Candidatus Anammoximicrobium sp.]|nr:hypothetical protein [Candidatus Anammoximicrobium sp.]